MTLRDVGRVPRAIAITPSLTSCLSGAEVLFRRHVAQHRRATADHRGAVAEVM